MSSDASGQVRQTREDEPRETASGHRSRPVDGVLNLERREDSEGPLEIEDEGRVDRRELEGDQPCGGDGLKEEDYVDDPPLSWARASGDELGSILKPRIRPRDVPGGVKPRDKDGEEGKAGGGPEDSGDASRPSVRERCLNARNEVARGDIREADLGVGGQVWNGVGDAGEGVGEIRGDGKRGSTCSKKEEFEEGREDANQSRFLREA